MLLHGCENYNKEKVNYVVKEKADLYIKDKNSEAKYKICTVITKDLLYFELETKR